MPTGWNSRMYEALLRFSTMKNILSFGLLHQGIVGSTWKSRAEETFENFLLSPFLPTDLSFMALLSPKVSSPNLPSSLPNAMLALVPSTHWTDEQESIWVKKDLKRTNTSDRAKRWFTGQARVVSLRWISDLLSIRLGSIYKRGKRAAINFKSHIPVVKMLSVRMIQDSRL